MNDDSQILIARLLTHQTLRRDDEYNDCVTKIKARIPATERRKAHAPIREKQPRGI